MEYISHPIFYDGTIMKQAMWLSILGSSTFARGGQERPVNHRPHFRKNLLTALLARVPPRGTVVRCEMTEFFKEQLYGLIYPFGEWWWFRRLKDVVVQNRIGHFPGRRCHCSGLSSSVCTLL